MMIARVDGKRSERGFSLIMIAASAVVMFGMMGLTTDLGRVYIAKNELQAFADASAVWAAFQLNGTGAGLLAADAAAASGPPGPTGSYNGWYFDSKKVPTPTVTYASSSGGTYYSSSSATVDPASRFVRVVVSADVPMFFLPIVPSISTAMTVKASAQSGQSIKNTIGAGGSNGVAPFSPDAHNPLDPNFGFTKTRLYTLRMTPPGHGGATCAGDLGWTDPNPPQDRGYINLGQGNSNVGIGEVLDYNTTYNMNITVGTDIPWVPGQKHVGPFANTRFYQDTNTTPGTYADYLAAGNGNGRRLLIMPVNDPTLSLGAGAAHVIGFGLFFMQNDFTSVYGNVDPLCGEYVGPATLNSMQPGPTPGTPGTFYAVQLFQ